ncbi:PAS domain S-box protein [Leptospira semungkisensis]|uniref:PAS domain S-box protein n=2 Tax=Leptospira semungkisensis TaxID=2484985 RepID=A0A4R9FNX3_9LEPT|nr:PAS domain S-box protein [Leptospira semungkisensis]
MLERIGHDCAFTSSQIWLKDRATENFRLKTRWQKEGTFASDNSSQENQNIGPKNYKDLTELFSQKNWKLNNELDQNSPIVSGLSFTALSFLSIPILVQEELNGYILFFSDQKKEIAEPYHAVFDLISSHLGSLLIERQGQHDIRESEERMRGVLENMPIMFFSVDENFQTISWNHECEKVLGYLAQEVIGNPSFSFQDLFYPLKSPSKMSLDSKVLDVDFKNLELNLISKDGKSKLVSLSNVSSGFPKYGSKKWFVGVDITRTKEIEIELKSSLKELSDFQTALNAVSIVAITDKQGKIIYVNQNFCDISGYSRDELLGQNHRIINSGYHPKEFFHDLWKTISKGKIWKGEIKNRAKDGKFYWVDTTISPVLDENEKPYQYLAIRNNITERKETEEKARHAENNLKTLQDRMSPHFLFNTLSIIHSYLQTNPDLADSAILMLADNYRFLTDQATKQLVPFDIEWEFTENYLQLLKLRFSDFLEVEVEKKGDFRNCQIPPLTLQPLVENSYIHGIRDKKGKGKIILNASVEGSKTQIIIRDNGNGLKTQNVYSRTIANIAERLKFYLYESEVKIENHPEGGAIVTIRFDYSPKLNS